MSWDEEIIEQCGLPIKGFEEYGILKNGTVRNNWNGHVLKPDKGGCVSLHRRNGRKSFSIARLVAIYWLDMPDEKQYTAFKKDANGGWGVDNITWDITNKARKEIIKQWHQRKKNDEEWLKATESID